MTVIVEPVLSRREQGKASRRDAIFDAARNLLRDEGHEVSAERIAQRAGVSTATLYNLIGPREQLLGALLSDLFEKLESDVNALGVADPLLFGEAVVTISVGLFCSDSALWRCVVHAAGSTYAVAVAPFVRLQPIELQKRAMREAKALGMLPKSVSTDMAAQQIYTSYNGALFMWAGGILSDAEFLNLAQSGFWLTIAALGARAERARALAVLQKIERESTSEDSAGRLGHLLSARARRGGDGGAAGPRTAAAARLADLDQP